MRVQTYGKRDRGIPGTSGVIGPLGPIRFPSVERDWFSRMRRFVGVGPCLVPGSFVDTFFVCQCGNLLVIVPGYPDFRSGLSVCRKCCRTWHVERKGDQYVVSYLGPTTVGVGAAGVGGG